MIELEEAVARIVANVQPLSSCCIPLAEALGRFLASDINAPVSLPPFDNSAMDGYALRAHDQARSSATAPARLRCIGAVPAGTIFNGKVTPGTCVRIFTGSPLPSDADAVVMQEDTTRSGDVVEVIEPVKPWENVRMAGEDVRAGDVIGRAGDVGRQPQVGILSTGDELVEAGKPLAPGQIYESNRTALAALARSVGATVRVYPLVRDTKEGTLTAIETALAECDAVVTSGGVSVGEHDFVKSAFERIGGKLEFWRVAIKPGKPFAFGRNGNKFLFGLPGNPVSAFVTFLLLVRPAILKMQGASELSLLAHPAALAEPLSNTGDRRHFVRVFAQHNGEVRGTGVQASHCLSSLARANALLDMPPKTSWAVGTPVQVLRWEL
jgi:molybdopterin molybdotransferase